MNGVAVFQLDGHRLRVHRWRCHENSNEGGRKSAKGRHQLKKPFDCNQKPMASSGPKPAISRVIFNRSGETCFLFCRSGMGQWDI